MIDGQLIQRARRSRLAIAALAAITFGPMLAACQSGGPASTQGATTQNLITPIGGSTAAASPTPAVIYPDATSTVDNSTPGTAGNVDVSPKQVTIGNVVLTLSIQPPQPAYDAGSTPSGNGGGDQQTPTPRRGFAVLGGSTLRITNNFDAAQSPPADSPQQILRHIAVQIKDKATGQLIPYAVVSMDLLLEGRPVLQDQALVPMLQAGANVSQMQYGNNVKIPGKGNYQIFVRLQPSPLLSTGANDVAQFNVSIK